MIYHLTKPEWQVHHREITFVDPSKLERIKTHLLKEDLLDFDSETTGFDPHEDELFCYQIGTENDQFVIDHRIIPIEEFKEVLESATLIGANLKFDLKFLFKHGIFPNSVEDIMLNEINLTNGLYSRGYIKQHKPYSFETLSRQYLEDLEVDKTIGKEFSLKDYKLPLYTKEILYGAKDARNPRLILKKQKALIEQKGLEAVCNLENKFTIALADMEYNGISLDTEKWQEIAKEVDKLVISSKQKLIDDLYASEMRFKNIIVNKKRIPLFYEYETNGGVFKCVCSINWSSPDQVKQVFNILDIDVDTVSAKKIIKLKSKYPFIESYLDYKGYDSLKAKFSDTLPNFVNKVTGKIHTDFWQIVSTGRLSASNPNLQQIPSKGTHGKAMRHCFIADEGEMLVTSDISGAELRIIAEASQDPLWLKTFREDKDLHGIIASELFGISPEDSKKLDFPLKPGTKYRDIVKTINFGLAYGMTEYKLGDTIGISIEEAKEIIDTYFEKVPMVKAYLDKSGKQVRRSGVAYTLAPIKRPRYFDMNVLETIPKSEVNYMLGRYERAGKNSPIQGTNADWVKIAICSIYDYIKTNNYPAKLRLTVHDEIVTSVKEELAEEWRIIQEGLMIQAGELFIKSVPIKVESNVGKVWSH